MSSSVGCMLSDNSLKISPCFGSISVPKYGTPFFFAQFTQSANISKLYRPEVFTSHDTCQSSADLDHKVLCVSISHQRRGHALTTRIRPQATYPSSLTGRDRRGCPPNGRLLCPCKTHLSLPQKIWSSRHR